MRVRSWGVRGAIPVPGPAVVRHGGNTPCIDILTDDQQVVIIDVGTGMRVLGYELRRSLPRGIEATILLSHTHWDHIHGLPFFEALQGRPNQGLDMPALLNDAPELSDEAVERIARGARQLFPRTDAAGGGLALDLPLP